MFTRPSLRKKVKDVSVMSAGHVLVLVFAAKRRHLALPAAWVGERAGRHVAFFSRNAICKSIVYAIISHGRIETKRKSI